MKKILLSSLVLLAFVLVACGPSGSTTVDIDNVNITSNVLEADFKLNVEFESDDELYELVTSAVNLTYDRYKTEIGTKLFTMYFTVYAKDSNEALGVISYKVNMSLEKPGLTYIGNNLS